MMTLKNGTRPQRGRRHLRAIAAVLSLLAIGSSGAIAQQEAADGAGVAPPSIALGGVVNGWGADSVKVYPATDVDLSSVPASQPVTIEPVASKSAPAPKPQATDFVPMLDATHKAATQPPNQISAAEQETVEPRPWKDSVERRMKHKESRGDGFSKLGIKVELETEVVHDDNILYSSRGEEVSDVIFRLRPGFFFHLGEESGDDGLFAQVAYRPTASIFTDFDGENSLDHDVGISFAARGAKLSTSVSAGYQTLSEATIDVSARTDRQVLKGDVLMEYALGAKTGLRAEFGYERADYDVFSDYDDWSSNLYFTYDLGAKTTIGIGYGYGVLRPSGDADQKYQRGLLRADWRATEKIALAAWGGADFRRSAGARETSGVFGLELDVMLREGTRIALRGYRDIGASALIETETFTLTGVSADIEQRLGKRFTGVVGVGFEDYDYTGGGELADSRSDKSFFVRPALRYQLRDELSGEVFYAFREGDSSIDLLDFENNQIGASMRYKF